MKRSDKHAEQFDLSSVHVVQNGGARAIAATPSSHSEVRRLRDTGHAREVRGVVRTPGALPARDWQRHRRHQKVPAIDFGPDGCLFACRQEF
jgi:hypothetical protein